MQACKRWLRQLLNPIQLIYRIEKCRGNPNKRKEDRTTARINNKQQVPEAKLDVCTQVAMLKLRVFFNGRSQVRQDSKVRLEKKWSKMEIFQGSGGYKTVPCSIGIVSRVPIMIKTPWAAFSANGILVRGGPKINYQNINQRIANRQLRWMQTSNGFSSNSSICSTSSWCNVQRGAAACRNTTAF